MISACSGVGRGGERAFTASILAHESLLADDQLTFEFDGPEARDEDRATAPEAPVLS
jgi:hypothetical protein